MNPEIILAQLNAALVETTTEFFSQFDFGSGDHQEQPSQPVQIPVMPVPFAGELSIQFAQRWPTNAPACTIPANLKYDPWHVSEVEPGVYSRGAWIPLDASFAQPVG